MKKIALLLAVLFAFGVAGCGEKPKKDKKKKKRWWKKDKKTEEKED